MIILNRMGLQPTRHFKTLLYWVPVRIISRRGDIICYLDLAIALLSLDFFWEVKSTSISRDTHKKFMKVFENFNIHMETCTYVCIEY